MRIGVLCSRIRVEEKLLLQEIERRGLEYVRIDDDDVVFDAHGERLIVSSMSLSENQFPLFGIMLTAPACSRRHR